MGIFNNGNNINNNQGGCDCPHCRGGHEPYIPESDYSFDNHLLEEENVEIESNEMVYNDDDTVTPEELIELYVNEIAYGGVNSFDELNELMLEFYQDIVMYAIKETHLADIENKITILNLLKNGK